MFVSNAALSESYPIQVRAGHCQSKFVYFAITSDPDFAVIESSRFSRVNLRGAVAAPSIWNLALTTPPVEMSTPR